MGYTIFMKKISLVNFSFLNLVFLSLMTISLSCQRIQTLNLEPHDYSKLPSHIILFQVPGLNIDQVGILKLISKDADSLTAFEKFSCIGQIWNFNLYEVQPHFKKSMITQINGNPNIKGQCEDYSSLPVWRYLSPLGYKTAVLEEVDHLEESILHAKSCDSKGNFLSENDLVLTMSPQKFFPGEEFHRAQRKFSDRGVFFDKACLSGSCTSSLELNVKDFYTDWFSKNQKSFLLLRSNQLMKAILSKDLSKVKESLGNINRIATYFQSFQSKSQVLFVLAGSQSIPIEMPKNSKEWEEYEKSEKNIFFKSASLMSPVFSYGNMSENFCGLFKESEFIKRLLYKPDRKKFYWDLLNPF